MVHCWVLLKQLWTPIQIWKHKSSWNELACRNLFFSQMEGCPCCPLVPDWFRTVGGGFVQSKLIFDCCINMSFIQNQKYCRWNSKSTLLHTKLLSVTIQLCPEQRETSPFLLLSFGLWPARKDHPTVWHSLLQKQDLWRGNCNWQMGRERKKEAPLGQKRRDGEREGQRQIFDRDKGGLIVGFDLLVNLHCLLKATRSMMRTPPSPNK